MARKYIPGQPAWLETTAAIGILIAAARCYLISTNLPKWILDPILVYVSVQCMFFAIGLLTDPPVALAGLVTRILPLLAFSIGHTCIRRPSDMRRAALPLLLLMAIQVPPAILLVVEGSAGNIVAFQPIQALTDAGRAVRSSVPAYSGFFTTQAALSTGLCLALGLSIVLQFTAIRTNWHRGLLWVSSASLLFLVYVSTRRGMLLVSLLGLTVYIIVAKWSITRITVVSLTVAAILVLTDRYGYVVGLDVERRSDLATNLDFQDRWTDVVVPVIRYWPTVVPLGTYLGAGGPEAGAFNRSLWVEHGVPIEFGFAMWTVEFGVIGACICTLSIAVLLFRLHKMASQSYIRSMGITLLAFATGLFVMFLLKELSIFAQANLAHILFWSMLGMIASLATIGDHDVQEGNLVSN